jgi:hypothetical protein
VKPLVIEDYTTHMSYTDLCDRMANSYSIRERTWNWMKKTIIPFVRSNCSEFIRCVQVMWRKYDPSEILGAAD